MSIQRTYQYLLRLDMLLKRTELDVLPAQFLRDRFWRWFFYVNWCGVNQDYSQKYAPHPLWKDVGRNIDIGPNWCFVFPPQLIPLHYPASSKLTPPTINNISYLYDCHTTEIKVWYYYGPWPPQKNALKIQKTTRKYTYPNDVFHTKMHTEKSKKHTIS